MRENIIVQISDCWQKPPRYDHPNGAALKRNLTRMAQIYQREDYARISGISVAHIYNLRKTVSYQRAVTVYNYTKKSSQVNESPGLMGSLDIYGLGLYIREIRLQQMEYIT